MAILILQHKNVLGEVKVGIDPKLNIITQACPGWGDGIDPETFVSSLYISVAIKGRLLKFNMFNRYKINISKLGLICS